MFDRHMGRTRQRNRETTCFSLLPPGVLGFPPARTHAAQLGVPRGRVQTAETSDGKKLPFPLEDDVTYMDYPGRTLHVIFSQSPSRSIQDFVAIAVLLRLLLTI